MSIAGILKVALPNDLVDALLAAYKEIETNYVHRKWKASELDAGHFVEAVRRVIEHHLFRSYTPLNKQLSQFTDKILQQYEQASGDESYRVLIPRVLRAIYGVRNKRGVGHLCAISPNEMDATLILYNAKWVIAEVVRLKSGLSPTETQREIERVIEPQTTLIWKDGDIVRVLDKSLKAREQVLLLLYDTSPQMAEELRDRCEYKNPANFKKILKRLHRDKFIFLGPDSKCIILPSGVEAAETMIRSKNSNA
jgi:hypothetical protein